MFRDVPTEEELFADDDAGPTTPLMRRGTNLPEGDEGFGATLRSLFSSNAPSERHSRHAPLTKIAWCTSPLCILPAVELQWFPPVQVRSFPFDAGHQWRGNAGVLANMCFSCLCSALLQGMPMP